MSPAPKDRPSVTDAAACALHGQRIDQLDDKTDSLETRADRTHDDVAALRTDVAVIRSDVDSIKRRLESSMPTLAQVILMLLTVGVTALATYLVAHPPQNPVPSAHAHPATR